MDKRLLVIGLLLMLVFSRCAPDARPRGASQRATLRISASGPQHRERVTITATVVNDSAQPIAWDREFSALMEWRVLRENMQPLERRVLAEANQPKTTEFRRRFVVLQPGESCSHDFELTFLVRQCQDGDRASGGKESLSGLYFYEEICQYRVPQFEERITVQLVRRPTCLRADEFDEWFGHHVGALPLILAEKVVSNELSISFP
jgi:hypothetical protein